MRHSQDAYLTVVQVGIPKAQLEQLQSADLPVTAVVRLAQQLIRQHGPAPQMSVTQAAMTPVTDLQASLETGSTSDIACFCINPHVSASTNSLSAAGCWML